VPMCYEATLLREKHFASLRMVNTALIIILSHFMRTICRVAISCFTAISLVFLLGGNYLQAHILTLIAPTDAASELFYLFGANDLQWFWVAFLLFLFGCLISMAEVRSALGHTSIILPVSSLLLIGGFQFYLNYDIASKTTNFLVLITALTSGIALASISLPRFESGVYICSFPDVSTILSTFMAIASILRSNTENIAKYHGHVRFSGPWENPNTYGLMLGVGVLLAVGSIITSLEQCYHAKVSDGGEGRINCNKHMSVAYYGVIVVMLLYGLLNSYSRGAWCGTLCGLCFFVTSWMGGAGIRRVCTRPHLKTTTFWLIIVTFLGILFASTNAYHEVISRTLSVFNQNDFSSRNRVAAYVGTLQMIADRPLIGYGWDNVGGIYSSFYMQSRLTEGDAILLNDYFYIAAALGIPALVSFIWLLAEGFKSFPSAEVYKVACRINGNVEIKLAHLWRSCRAATILLLVGFWFDGGLFKLPLATVFWVLFFFQAMLAGSLRVR
jgi:hypothetical protein